MKKLLILILCLPLLTYSQSKDEQVVVKYSVDYKLPLMKRMMKKMMPKSFIYYYSENGSRNDASHSFSLLGVKGKMEGSNIKNYNTMKSLNTMIIGGESEGESEDTTVYTKEDIVIDTISKINYTGKKKKILDIDCIGFIVENNEFIKKGFLTTEFSAIGAIIEGHDFGLPMELEIYNKKEKITAISKAEKLSIEKLNKSYYLIE